MPCAHGHKAMACASNCYCMPIKACGKIESTMSEAKDIMNTMSPKARISVSSSQRLGDESHHSRATSNEAFVKHDNFLNMQKPSLVNMMQIDA